MLRQSGNPTRFSPPKAQILPPTVDLSAPPRYPPRVVLYSELRATLNIPLKRVRVSNPEALWFRGFLLPEGLAL